MVTSLEGDAQALYDRLYCARGDMENRIKEQQLDLFADRTSCHHWWANQFRLLLASLAYTLIETIRRVGLKGTELARAYVGTIRLKLFKIAAVILINTRRVEVPARQHLSVPEPLLPGGAPAGQRIDREPTRLRRRGALTPRQGAPHRWENDRIVQHHPIVSGKMNRCSASTAI